MANEVTEMLDELNAGSISVEEVAARFRARRWPQRPSRPPANHLEMAAAELQDPELHLPSSFDDVVAAYDTKKITREQFRILSKAVADAQAEC